MDDKTFDDIIKQKLSEGITSPVSPNWEAFKEDFLNKEELDNIRFDKEISSKLGTFMATGSHDWEDFQKNFGDQISEDKFDHEISEKLKNHHIPYISSHWAILKEKLEREAHFKNALYFSKFVESAFVFLLIFTFFNISNHLGGKKKPYKENVEKTMKSPDIATKIQDETFDSNINTIHSEQVVLNQIERKPLITKESSPHINENLVLVDQHHLGDENTVDLQAEMSYSSDIVQDDLASLKEVVSMPIQDKVYVTEIERIKIEELNHDHKFSFPVVPVWALDDISSTYVSYHFAPSVNIVNSPFDYINKTDPYSTDALGFEAGVSYSRKKNNFEIGVGGFLTRKSYQPRADTEVSGSFSSSYKATSIKNITYDVMGIPINARLHVVNNKNWSMFASVGASFNLIGATDYVLIENGREVDNPARSTNLARKDFSPGLLQGGNIFDNLFLTFDYGIGFEKRINQNTYFHIAPTLRQHVGMVGIGPNSDKVHSLGLNLGLKKRL